MNTPGGRPLHFCPGAWPGRGKYDVPDGTVEPIGLRRVVATHTFLPRTSPKIHFWGEKIFRPLKESGSVLGKTGGGGGK